MIKEIFYKDNIIKGGTRTQLKSITFQLNNPQTFPMIFPASMQFTNQRPQVIKAKKSVAVFKVRASMPVGVKITIRGRDLKNFVSVLATNIIHFNRANTLEYGFNNFNLGSLNSGFSLHFDIKGENKLFCLSNELRI